MLLRLECVFLVALERKLCGKEATGPPRLAAPPLPASEVLVPTTFTSIIPQLIAAVSRTGDRGLSGGCPSVEADKHTWAY